MLKPMKTKLRSLSNQAITLAKRIFYFGRGEPICYGNLRLRYLPGTRPLRLKYINSENPVVRGDARQIQFFLDHVKSGDFVLDIGGHAGQYAVIFAAKTGTDGRVISFEPDPWARDVLRKNLNLNGFAQRVQVEEIALTDKVGNMPFFSKGGNSQSSLARSALGGEAADPQVTTLTVNTDTLDNYLAKRSLGVPQWLKLDTEGAEINILRGAPLLLKSDAKIICELHPFAWPEFGTNFQELLELVRAAGKQIEYLDERCKIANGPVYGSVLIS